MWFITESKFVLIPFSDLSSPDKASSKMEGEFKFPDTLIEITMIENKTVKTKTWKKHK
jgi:hypothetical protein